MKVRAAALVAALMVMTSVPAWAQRVEVSGLVGWTFSDGVEGDPYTVGGGTFDAIDLRDSASWGLALGVNATDKVEVGFVFNQQLSTLAVTGSTELELGDVSVNTYHPYVAYNFGERQAAARPYVMVGFGATRFGGVEYTRLDGTRATTRSETQYSTTWGAGVKVFGDRNVGFRLGFQWTPTYIATDSEGWWCDPYYGCFVVEETKYSNQLTLNGGVTIRF